MPGSVNATSIRDLLLLENGYHLDICAVTTDRGIDGSGAKAHRNLIGFQVFQDRAKVNRGR